MVNSPIPSPLPKRRRQRGGRITLAAEWLACAVALAVGAAVAESAPFEESAPVPAKPATATNAPAAAEVFATMETLDDANKLSLGDHLSFRILEDRVDPKESLEPKQLIITDSGDVEVPYIGRFPAAGKTCRRLAAEIKTELEKTYYYQATVIVAIDAKTRSSGRVYITGEVRQNGPVEMPGDEAFTVSKAVLRAGGFTEFADKRHVKVTRKVAGSKTDSKTLVIDLAEVMERGKTEKDTTLEPNDAVFVPSRLFNF